MGTAVVGLGLIVLGALLVWFAWRGSQHGAPPQQAGAAPLGLTGGICVLAGLAIVVSGLDSTPGLVALAIATVTVLCGLLTTAVLVRRAA